MKQLFAISFYCWAPPLFAGSVDQGSGAALQPVWIQLLMLFAVLLVGITSRQISRIR